MYSWWYGEAEQHNLLFQRSQRGLEIVARMFYGVAEVVHVTTSKEDALRTSEAILLSVMGWWLSPGNFVSFMSLVACTKLLERQKVCSSDLLCALLHCFRDLLKYKLDISYGKLLKMIFCELQSCGFCLRASQPQYCGKGTNSLVVEKVQELFGPVMA